MKYTNINLNDKELEKIINNELKRQQNHIELIASENYVSNDVLNAAGSILTNKYGEGYPNARYYGGCEFVDQVENLAIERLKQIFNVKYANVQPHSGSSANAAAIASLIKPGQKILGMSLSNGGHLTHGYHVNFSGTFYESVTYGVNSQGYLDYDEILEIAKKENPDLIICGASCYSRVIDFKKFREIANTVNAKLIADIAHIAGLIAVGLHPSPVGYADVITSTTHKTLRGARGGIIMTNDSELAKSINKWVFPGYQGGPLFHIIAAKAACFNEVLKPEFKEYQKQILKNAKALENELKKLNVEIISNGTDNHLLSINTLKTFNLTGKEAEVLLAKINITVNKNSIPNDTLPPTKTSGIRIGTPAMTTRGFKEEEFKIIANIIYNYLKGDYHDDKKTNDYIKEIEKLTMKFPLI